MGLLFQVLEYLCGSGNASDEETVSSRHEERQQALMELVQAGGLAHYDPEKLVQKARSAKLLVLVL